MGNRDVAEQLDVAIDMINRIEAVLEPDWVPAHDTTHSTKYVGWIDAQRVHAIRNIVEGRDA